MTANPPISQRVRVLIVDSEPLVRAGLTDRLNAGHDLEVVGTAAISKTALNLVKKLKPDVAVIDGQLPDGTGLELCRQIRALGSPTQCVLYCSVNDDTADETHLAAAVVGKQLYGDELSRTIRRVANGSQRPY